MRSYAVLIDAGFLKRKRASRQRPLTAESVKQFVDELRSLPALEASIFIVSIFTTHRHFNRPSENRFPAEG